MQREKKQKHKTHGESQRQEPNEKCRTDRAGEREGIRENILDGRKRHHLTHVYLVFAYTLNLSRHHTNDEQTNEATCIFARMSMYPGTARLNPARLSLVRREQHKKPQRKQWERNERRRTMRTARQKGSQKREPNKAGARKKN